MVDLPWWLNVEESPAARQETQGNGFDPWVGKIPRRRKRQPTPVFLPGESHRQRKLAGYSPRGHRESDTTDQACKMTPMISLGKRNATLIGSWSVLSRKEKCFRLKPARWSTGACEQMKQNPIKPPLPGRPCSFLEYKHCSDLYINGYKVEWQLCKLIKNWKPNSNVFWFSVWLDVGSGEICFVLFFFFFEYLDDSVFLPDRNHVGPCTTNKSVKYVSPPGLR